MDVREQIWNITIRLGASTKHDYIEAHSDSDPLTINEKHLA